MQDDPRARILSVARGAQPADLLLTNGRIVNVFSGLIEQADIAIADGTIAGIGPGYAARQTESLDGAFVAPGLIDAHVHIESSLCLPGEFAAAIVPRGVTTAVIDPHEIANVAGLDGIRFMIEASRGLPLRVVPMASSCVPATHLATSAASLDADALRSLRDEELAHGLAEVMNFPGVINGDPTVLAKLRAFDGLPQDGHAPGVLGKQLNAYAAAGIGSDHECISVEEAAEKLARGLYILVREASNARDLDALLPLVTPANSRRFCFCTDDRQPADLLDQGSIDSMLRRAIAFGIDPVTAFCMATLNSAEWFGLRDRGAVAPGRLADLMIFDDLQNPQARLVYSGGQRVGGEPPRPCRIPPAIASRCRVRPDLDLSIKAKSSRIRVIGVRPDQLVTDHLVLDTTTEHGLAVADPSRDILKMAVIERHNGGSQYGLGFIQGFGLRRGAIAGTIAHDHHNLVVIGVDEISMRTAIAHLSQIGGGLVAVGGGQVIADLPLPVAGLMSDRPVAAVRASYDRLRSAATDLGCRLDDPFMAMSFMALEVIPSLKLTDRGLVDVANFRFVDLFV